LELALECFDTLNDLGLLQAFCELLRIDADWKCADSDNFALVFDTIWCCWESPKIVSIGSSLALQAMIIQYPGTTAQKVASIVVGVESNEIAMKNAKKNLVSNGKNAVDLTTWERGMEEETNLDILL
jgi:hypothetical protein